MSRFTPSASRATRSRRRRAGSSTSSPAASAGTRRRSSSTTCAPRHGIPVWHGGMLESGIGRAHNIHLASLPNFSLPGDIAASKRYYQPDLIDPPIDIAADGTIAVPDGPGNWCQHRPRSDRRRPLAAHELMTTRRCPAVSPALRSATGELRSRRRRGPRRRTRARRRRSSSRRCAGSCSSRTSGSCAAVGGDLLTLLTDHGSARPAPQRRWRSAASSCRRHRRR